jgi:hypothetical protein
LASNLINPRGDEIVEAFFDVGQSRSLPWQRRPEASRLLATLADPRRGFEAVVIGEPHRAFYGNQFGLTLPTFAHYGVQLWVPEVGGAIDPDNEAHDPVMSVFGGMSRGSATGSKCGWAPPWRRRPCWRAATGTAPALRLHHPGRRAASEPGQGRKRQAAARPDPGSGHRTGGASHLCRVPQRQRRVRYRRGADARRDPVPVGV